MKSASWAMQFQAKNIQLQKTIKFLFILVFNLKDINFHASDTQFVILRLFVKVFRFILSIIVVFFFFLLLLLFFFFLIK